MDFTAHVNYEVKIKESKNKEKYIDLGKFTFFLDYHKIEIRCIIIIIIIIIRVV